MSQRVRQIQERAACEQELPECRPVIREQLQAERRRLRLGLGALAAFGAVASAVLYQRILADKRMKKAAAERLDERLDAFSGDSEQDQAKSDSS
jgi:hypothetical protein